MNNNRGNNRRRGRGNNRSQGGNQLNRIDSRARGNAPQLLEKYRKLAQDASLNGDRVQAEYYLQFADHYFRVIADTRSQKEEFRPRRDGERDQDGFDDEGDFDRGRRGPDDRFEARGEDAGDDQAEREPASEFEPPENPFVRDNRQQRPRNRDDRPARRPRGEGRAPREEQAESAPQSIDEAVLPPAINVAEPSPEPVTEAEAPAEAPKPRRRTRRTKADDGEALENVG